jgi:hypothetical protein
MGIPNSNTFLKKKPEQPTQKHKDCAFEIVGRNSKRKWFLLPQVLNGREKKDQRQEVKQQKNPKSFPNRTQSQEFEEKTH